MLVLEEVLCLGGWGLSGYVRSIRITGGTVNYGQLRSITVNYGRLRSITVEYGRLRVNCGQLWSIRVRGGLRSITVNYGKSKLISVRGGLKVIGRLLDGTRTVIGGLFCDYFTVI